MHIRTVSIHGKGTFGHKHKAVATPIFQTSAFQFDSADEGAAVFAGAEGFAYTRFHNPNVLEFEQIVAALEGTDDACAFASGMAAISGVVRQFLKSGDHIVASPVLYGATYGLFRQVLPDWGIETTFAASGEVADLAAAIRPNTRLIYVETPANPTMDLVDLPGVAKLGQERGILTCCDNTFLTPVYQQPCRDGLDLSLHSATKYFGGHGDAIGGVVAGRADLIAQLKKGVLRAEGGCLSPFNAWLLVRGLATLPLRMAAHTETAQAVAAFLRDHPAVEQVHYPGQSGTMSFVLAGGYDAGKRLMDRVKLCLRAVSLGDVATLIQHPASMTHRMIPAEEQARQGIVPGLIRLSVGLEHADDIIADLEQALA